ncbi:hypothetical protein [Pseudonocardia sp. NPDC049635]|uniref:hypothetical protein n=1 Tax=Pseudonocardia sp. NPDC049635 TaxID=3155506 RepID=UPI0034048663
MNEPDDRGYTGPAGAHDGTSSVTGARRRRHRRCRARRPSCPHLDPAELPIEDDDALSVPDATSTHRVRHPRVTG